MKSDVNKSVKEALDQINIMALSTIGPDGSWSSPVHYTSNERLELTFKSMLDTRHVQNILKDPRVSVAIFSDRGPEGGILGLQITGHAEHVNEQASADAWQEFKIIPDEVWCFDSRIKMKRQRVDLSRF